MGNEISAEAGAQPQEAGFDFNQLEPVQAPVDTQKREESPISNEDQMKPLHDAQLSKLIKMDSSEIDIHDTGVSDELQKLLATLHEDDGPPVPGAHSLTIPTLPLTSKPAFSAAAQEFVPGKPFNLGAPVGSPSVDREVSSVSSDQLGVSGGFGTLKADAPEFVPSWQAKPAAAAAGGVLPLPQTAAAVAAANLRVVDKKVWYYRDPAGIVRGPFSTTEMRAWADKGYFTGTLEIALSDRGPYLPLSAVYPAPERPFWKSIEPREFATRMRQHIVSTQGGMTSETQSN